jgi:hypothetical protein
MAHVLSFLAKKKGITEGDPIAIFIYRIGLFRLNLPRSNNLGMWMMQEWAAIDPFNTTSSD